MDAQGLEQFYTDFLKEEGYVPKIEDDGDIVFKFEGDTYSIAFDEDDAAYFRLYAVFGRECEHDDERAKLFKAASDTNGEMKMSKTIIVDDETIVVAIETLLNNQEDFKLNLRRWLAVIKDSADTFAEKMKTQAN